MVPESVESSIMLASHALALIGVPLPRILKRIREVVHDVDREGEARLYAFVEVVFREAIPDGIVDAALCADGGAEVELEIVERDGVRVEAVWRRPEGPCRDER